MITSIFTYRRNFADFIALRCVKKHLFGNLNPLLLCLNLVSPSADELFKVFFDSLLYLFEILQLTEYPRLILKSRRCSSLRPLHDALCLTLHNVFEQLFLVLAHWLLGIDASGSTTPAGDRARLGFRYEAVEFFF